MKVAVLGAGSWGTTLAVHLAKLGHEAALWSNQRADLTQLAAERENRKFLPGIRLPDGVKVQPELGSALAGASVTIYAVPSQAVREVAREVAKSGARSLAVSVSKGLELGTLQRLSQVLSESLGDAAPVVLTGPSHAEEVSRDVPTSVVAASSEPGRAQQAQQLFSSATFRVYTNDDVAGCEYGAALKNVVAIAAGVVDGLGFGDNTKAALLTRGLAEMARLGIALGGRRETFFGLAGMGDLIVTAISRHSRNRGVGERLGRGESLDAILASMVMVAEGVPTARAAREVGRRHGLDLPIVEQVCAMMFEGRAPREALGLLMSRGLKSEN